MKITTTRIAVGLVFAGALCAQSAFSASNYPARPVTIVVPMAPGGATDVLARYEAEVLQRELHQAFVVENRPGAGGVLGTSYAAKADPDGYTLLHTGTSFSLIPQLTKDLPYNPVTTFKGVSFTAIDHYVLVVNPSLNVNSVPELIELAKKNPGQLTYASAGLGTSQFFFAELFKSMAKVDIQHVPYKGSAPALFDVMAGHVSMMFVDLPAAIEYVRHGKVKGLAVTSLARSAEMPELPSVAETLPGYEAIGWQGLLANSGTPKEIVDKLNAPLTVDLKRPKTAERFKALGLDPKSSTPEEFGSWIKSEFAKWKRVTEDAGIKGF